MMYQWTFAKNKLPGEDCRGRIIGTYYAKSEEEKSYFLDGLIVEVDYLNGQWINVETEEPIEINAWMEVEEPMYYYTDKEYKAVEPALHPNKFSYFDYTMATGNDEWSTETVAHEFDISKEVLTMIVKDTILEDKEVWTRADRLYLYPIMKSKGILPFNERKKE